MKAALQQVPGKFRKSFFVMKVDRESRPNLEQAWHYHPEMEICFTLQGKGKRFVGNNIDTYSDSDLVMFGSNLPHGFISNDKCVQLVLFFNQDMLEFDLFKNHDIKVVKNLFKDSSRGLEFQKDTKKEVKDLLLKAIKSSGMVKVINLLQILQLLATTPNRRFICDDEFKVDEKEIHLKRINLVYNHIMQHYTEPICVKDVADLVNLSEPSFYKFIKRHTKKKFTEIINEYRLNQASKMLRNTDRSVGEICYANGFNNLSYFNRKFKVATNQTPSDYRANYQSSRAG